MNILAATTPSQPMPAQPSPYQQMPQYQPVMVQPSAPAQKGPSTIGIIYATLNLAAVVFIVVMVYRFVVAWERIADKIDKGIVVRKEDTPA